MGELYDKEQKRSQLEPPGNRDQINLPGQKGWMSWMEKRTELGREARGSSRFGEPGERQA